MSSTIIKNILKSKYNNKIFYRNNFNLTLSNTLSYTKQKLKRNNTITSIKYTSPSSITKKISAIKPKNKYYYALGKNQKSIKQIKIFDEINNYSNLNKNFDKINFKTIEYMNNERRKKTLKKYNYFKSINNNKKHITNKPPTTLKNELYKLDRNFLREISPINNFITINKKVNKFKKENKRILLENKDNFYFNVNSIRDKNKENKILNCNFSDNYNNKKFIYPNKNNKNYNCRRIEFDF